MDERYLKWSLLVPAALLLFAIIAFIIYIIVPVDSVRSILAIAAMLSIIVAAVSTLVPQIIATIEVAGSNKISNARKVLWIVLFWVLLGVIAVIIYYFLDRKNTI